MDQSKKNAIRNITLGVGVAIACALFIVYGPIPDNGPAIEIGRGHSAVYFERYTGLEFAVLVLVAFIRAFVAINYILKGMIQLSDRGDKQLAIVLGVLGFAIVVACLWLIR